ncbi:MAG: alpha,alpha-trehalose-phosphate synthase (UDP-forming) [Gemmatimonadaceae bacterium]
MGARLRAIATLAAVIWLLAWGANALLTRITASWIAQDALQRADLAVASARSALVEHWRASDTTELRRVLVDIAADDQMLAVAACADGPSPLARTERYPPTLSCTTARRLAPGSGAGLAPTRARVGRVDGLPVTVVAIVDDTTTVGSLVLVHDVRLAELRVAEIRNVVLGGFAIFGLASIVFAFFSHRLLRQSWTKEIRLVLGGFSNATESRALLADLRSLAARVTAESDARDEERSWTPARVKALVRDTLEGARVIILANREPLIHQRDTTGSVRHMRPASGLVSALEPVIRACAGTWVAHGSGSADREFVDAQDRLQIHPESEPYTLRRVWLTPEQEQGYYYGFANEGLWPLCHIAHRRPTFRSADLAQYRDVNRRFVDAVCQEAGTDDPIVLIQDYHFAFAPQMLRERKPAATIVAFWHIPWPNAERLSICPWHNEIVEGMLGASIIGFHTQQHCNNFIDAVDTFVEARIDRERFAVVRHGRRSLVRPYPISVEWPQLWSQTAPKADEARRLIIEKYQLPGDALIGIGVDRLDYTKGLVERFLAVERVLERHPELQKRFTFIQISAPSRTHIPWYQHLSVTVQAEADRINARFGRQGYRPIILLQEHHEHESIALHYRAAAVCYVSSVHDGMNLVAKEFVAARDDEQGVLVLSHFAGASRELTEALIVNPYDIDEASGALARALSMPAREQRERMRSMRSQVRDRNVFRWAGRLLMDAARYRREALLAERLRRVPGLGVPA